MSASFAVINLCLIIPLYFGASVANDKPAKLRAVMMNVSRENRDDDKVGQFIRSAAPDFIVVDEVTWAWLDKLREMTADYPFSKSRPQEDEFGIALFSRIPFENAKIVKLGTLEFKAVKATMAIHGKRLTVFGVHPPPPVSQIYREERIRCLEQLSTLVSLRTSR